MSSTVTITEVTINDLPDELLRLISISAGPTEYCNFRRAIKRVWEYTTGREDQCIKHFLMTKVDEDGTTVTTLCGEYHSMFDQPAYIDSDRMQLWYRCGKFHRDNDLPAYIGSNGTQIWVQYGKRHRDNDLPAVINATGTQEWWKHDKKYTP